MKITDNTIRKIENLTEEQLERVSETLQLDPEIDLKDQILEYLEGGALSLTELDSILRQSICTLNVQHWESQKQKFITLLKDIDVLKELINNGELSGFKSKEGRITFNKTLDETSFAQFTDILVDIINFKKVFTASKRSLVPLNMILDDPGTGFLQAVDRRGAKLLQYPYYVFIHATLAESYKDEKEELQGNIKEIRRLTRYILTMERPVLALCILTNPYLSMAHAIAIVGYQNLDGTVSLAYFDPLSYRRIRRPEKEERKGDRIIEGQLNEYDYAPKAFNAMKKLKNVKFQNLGELCYHRNPNEFSCTQYVIDADYCYLYSLHFLVELINRFRQRGNLNLETLQLAVDDTYIVDPKKLTRDDTYESLVYRVIIMSFIISSLYCYLLNDYLPSRNLSQYLTVIEKFNQRFRGLYGFDLLIKF